MEIKELTKKLIAIPSYVDDSTNEAAIGDYIYSYLKKNTKLTVIKEKVIGNRYNIIAYSPLCQKSTDSFEIDALFIDHIDTVEPKEGWTSNQFSGIENQGKLYGLGAVDTKGNVAILMKLAELITDEKYMFLFYVDEEYDFKGIKSFIADYKNRLIVKQIISTDGEDLEIRNASRGLIELNISCTGRSGHAANPRNGISTIRAFTTVLYQLEKSLYKKVDNDLGRTTMNVSYIQAGLYRGKNGNQVIFGKSGNNIPDYLEATIEFRVNSSIDLVVIQKMLTKLCRQERIAIAITKVTHSLKPWRTKKRELSFLTNKFKKNKLKVSYTNAGKSGYVDIALLNEAFKTTCYCIGVTGANRHGVNEYLEIESLYTLFALLKMMYNTK